MPRKSKPPRLWLKPSQRNAEGQITHAAVWVILDGGRQHGTGCHAQDSDGANRALADYIGAKYSTEARSGPRETHEIPVADVLNLYARDVVPKHANANRKHAITKITRLGKFFSEKTLAHVNGQVCRAYAEQSSTDIVARDDLATLQAAINHHHREGLHDRAIRVWMPPRRAPRDRWLTRDEAAQMLRRAWRIRVADRRPRRHLVRFMLVGLYTGSRANVIASASFERQPGRPFIDLTDGMFYRRAPGTVETKKRTPAVRLPPRLLAHMRRWHRLGAKYPVEMNGKPVARVRFAFQWTAEECGIKDATPHTLRHTAATWLMQQGADIWAVAGYLGMSVQTLERVYGHHHPNHSKAIHAAFSRRSPSTFHQRNA